MKFWQVMSISMCKNLLEHDRHLKNMLANHVRFYSNIILLRKLQIIVWNNFSE